MFENPYVFRQLNTIPDPTVEDLGMEGKEIP